jgi:DNA-binding NarL/FixJ family response regulator
MSDLKFVSMTMKVAIAEDNARLAEMFQARMAAFQDVEIVFVARNGADLLQKMQAHPSVDIVVMDIHMPGTDGVAATAVLTQRWPQVHVLMFTMFDDEEHLFAAILAGAVGYLMKDASSDEIHATLVAVRLGGAPMSSAIAHKTLSMIGSGKLQPIDAPTHLLATHEIALLRLLAHGWSYDHIAGNLSIGQHAIRNCIVHIYHKLQAIHKRAALQNLPRAGWM